MAGQNRELRELKSMCFFKEHQLDSGLAKFDADPDFYNAWNRLERGDFVTSDVDLLKHEIFESSLKKFSKLIKEPLMMKLFVLAKLGNRSNKNGFLY